MSTPGFYDPSHAGQFFYQPDVQELLHQSSEWKSAHQVRPSGEDNFRTHLLLIDLQKDFCFPEGNLYVGGRSGNGAIEDNDRIARFIYRNASQITDIICTLDTHQPFQIFFPSFWLDHNSNPPPPHTVIEAKDLHEGKFRPHPEMTSSLCEGDYDWLQKQVVHYCESLQSSGKYQLYLWPPHCLIGSPGHNLAGVIDEARMFHSFLRHNPGRIELKGDDPLTENYSAFAAEVTSCHDGEPLGKKNSQLVEYLLQSDRILIAGQAASHCVKSTIDDLLSEIQAIDPKLANKVYLLTDCMSSVTVPDPDHSGEFVVDFTEQTNAAFGRFESEGMNLITSDCPLEEIATP